MIKAIVFDFDGVLVESLDIKTRGFASLFEDEGPHIQNKVVDYHLGNMGVSRFDKIRHYYRHFLKRELDEETFGKLCATFSSFVKEQTIHCRAVKGAMAFLDRYHRQYACFIASATPHEELQDIVAARGMGAYFQDISGAPRKKAEVVRKIMEREGYSPDEVVFIGDAMSDFEAAQSNGVHFIARMTETNVFQHTGCVKVKDLTGLHEALTTLQSKAVEST